MSVVSNSSGALCSNNPSAPIPVNNNQSGSHGNSNSSTPPINTAVQSAQVPVVLSSQAASQMSPTISSDHDQPPIPAALKVHELKEQKSTFIIKLL